MLVYRYFDRVESRRQSYFAVEMLANCSNASESWSKTYSIPLIQGVTGHEALVLPLLESSHSSTSCTKHLLTRQQSFLAVLFDHSEDSTYADHDGVGQESLERNGHIWSVAVGTDSIDTVKRELTS